MESRGKIGSWVAEGSPSSIEPAVLRIAIGVAQESESPECLPGFKGLSAKDRSLLALLPFRGPNFSGPWG